MSGTKTKRINFDEPIADTFGVEVSSTNTGRVIMTAIDRQGRPRSVVPFPQADLEEVVNSLWTLGSELGQPWAQALLVMPPEKKPAKKGGKRRV
jgi:hypothetical protein